MMDERTRKLIGQRIREQRLKNDYSQEGLAEALDMKRTNVANYEAGRVVPPGGVLLKLSKLFHVSTDYLLGNTDRTIQTDEEMEDILVQIQRAKKRMSPEEKIKTDNLLQMIKLSFHDAFNEDDEEDDEDL
jgi:transcriptional regulator with XRE-family HTH domain